MVTQPKKARQWGPRFAAEVQERMAAIIAQRQATSADAPNQRAYAGAPERNLRTNDRIDLREQIKLEEQSTGKINEDWKVERLDGSVASTHVATSLSSYKAQKLEISEKFPLARFQNPSNNPEVALLLERYGDLRQVILQSSIFKTPCAKVEDGGWGTGVGGLITLAKQYGLERVLWAVRETKNYRGAREPGKYFSHILRKGLEAGR